MRRATFFTVLIMAAIAALALTTGSHAAAEARTSVTVNGESSVTGDFIHLGDIARIDSEDPLLQERLSSIVIGRSPFPKQVRTIGGAFIKRRLAQKGIALKEIEFKSPPKVKVTRVYAEVSGETLNKIVREFILNEMPWERENVNIEGANYDGTILLPKGRLTYQVIPKLNEDYLGSTPLLVVFKVDDKPRKRIWVNPYIEVYESIVVSARPIPRHHLVNKDDLKVERRNLAGLASNLLTRPEEAIGKKIKTTLRANTPLREDMLELPPLVRRGDIVTIVLENKYVKITAMGMVRDKGRRGDTVRVINLKSRQEVYGKVIDEGTVKVNF